MNKYLILVNVLFFIFCGTAQADFYQWEDENGIAHITDYPPPVKSGKKVQVHKYDSDVQGEQEQVSEEKKEADVILYTKDSCADCDKAREFLQAKKIPFTEYNTDTSKEAAKKRKTIDDGDDVPFAVINKDQVHGFSESVYNRLLKIKP